MIKVLAIFIASIIGIILGHIFGPLSNLPSHFLVTEKYFTILHTHFLVIGLTSSAVAAIVGYALRVKVVRIAVIILVTAILFVVLSQLSEPNPLEFLLDNLADFLLYYLSTAIPLLFLLWGLNQWLKRRHALQGA